MVIILLVASMLIGSFLSYDLYYKVIEKSDTLEQLQLRSKEKEALLTTLNAFKATAGSPDTASDIDRYAGLFREDLLLSDLSRVSGTGAAMGNVTIDRWSKLPSGLSLASISLAVQTNTLDDLLTFLDRLNDANGKRRYFVKNMSIPLDFSTNLPVSTTLSLGLFYLK